MAKPAGVLFDFDGVVVDSLAVHLRAWQQAYQHIYSQELTSTDGLAGRSTMAIATILAELAGKPLTASQLAEEKRSQLRFSQHQIPPIPGALEAFQYLTENHIPFGIASNAPRSFILQTLESLKVRVPHVFGCDDVLRPKPEPDVFLACARAAGISFTVHANTIVFEDSVHGLKAAVRAGMHPIGVTTQNSAAALQSGGAIKTCANIAEAMAFGWFHEI